VSTDKDQKDQKDQKDELDSDLPIDEETAEQVIGGLRNGHDPKHAAG
jgi:hypothetical protein